MSGDQVLTSSCIHRSLHTPLLYTRALIVDAQRPTMRNPGRSIGVTSAVLLGWLTVAAVSAADRDLRLIDAVKSQDQQRVRTLLSQHVDVNVRSDDGSTALLWSAHWNDVSTAD